MKDCLKCNPLKINRIDGHYIDDIHKSYRFDYSGFISSISLLTLNNWSDELIDKLIKKIYIHKIIIVMNNSYIDSFAEYEIVAWYVSVGKLNIIVRRIYPLYHLYYKYVNIFGMNVSAEMLYIWLELTKHMSNDQIDEMKTLLLTLCI